VHGDKGKYQKALSNYIRDLSQRRKPASAFRKRFGGNTKAFQARYVQWWMSLKDNPTAELYDRIKVLTLTSYLARARGTRRKFATFDALATAADDGTFDKVFVEIGKRQPALWLPVSLLKRTMPLGDAKARWSLIGNSNAPRIQLALGDGSALVGSFRSGGRITVKVVKTKTEDMKRGHP
jgi:hypothetical protein